MPKPIAVASSFASRLGIFLLASIALTMTPVIVRSIVRLRVEGDLSADVVKGLAILAGVSGAVMIAASVYSLWFAMLGKDADVPTE